MHSRQNIRLTHHKPITSQHAGGNPVSKKILVVLSEFGFWGEELVGPLEVLDEHGYESVFMTAKGKRAHALPPSMDPTYIDPPLDKPVTSEYYAQKTPSACGSGSRSARTSVPRVSPTRSKTITTSAMNAGANWKNTTHC
jgi:putative intracellular protease/amidase